ncbi:MAG: hypothetical protein F6K14_10565 [Symploca sp. SIO2C1]|nr:hypothetical protein [Symploca sp. SIO2C1]
MDISQEIEANIQAILLDPSKVNVNQYIGLPLFVQKVQVRSDIERAIAKYEPRAAITDIRFVDQATGQLNMMVEWQLKQRFPVGITSAIDQPPDVSGLPNDAAIKSLVDWAIAVYIGETKAIKETVQERLKAAFESDQRFKLLTCMVAPVKDTTFALTISMETYSLPQLKYDGISRYDITFEYG